jgi:hypothetical protein
MKPEFWEAEYEGGALALLAAPATRRHIVRAHQ